MILVTGAAGLGGSIAIFEFAGNGVPMLGAGSQSREGDREPRAMSRPSKGIWRAPKHWIAYLRGSIAP